MNADTIVKDLIKLRRESIEKNNLVDIEIPCPSLDVMNCIREYDGEVGAEKWEQWCHSGGTCSHNSHDEGQSSRYVTVPKSWLLEKTRISELAIVFNVENSHRISGIMVIPDDSPKLVYTVSEGQAWSDYSCITETREKESKNSENTL